MTAWQRVTKFDRRAVALAVDRRRVRSVNPGYCFKLAGWSLDRQFRHPFLLRLRAAVVS